MSSIVAVKDYFVDPIFHASDAAHALMSPFIMREAVSIPCGHTFEGSQIRGWLKIQSSNCPLCKAGLTDFKLFSNIRVQKAIDVLHDPRNAEIKRLEDLTDEDQNSVRLGMAAIQRRREDDARADPPVPDRLRPSVWCLQDREPKFLNSYNCCGL